MSNINFVPDDYIQSNESRRANLMCLILFSVVMAALGGSFVTIKIRQRACGAEESLVNARMAKMEESIKQFEDLQSRRQDMMRTALTTAELIEPVPRSVLLASLTNTLPPGVSLIKLGLMQKQDKSKGQPAGASKPKYQAAQNKSARGVGREDFGGRGGLDPDGHRGDRPERSCRSPRTLSTWAIPSWLRTWTWSSRRRRRSRTRPSASSS